MKVFTFWLWVVIGPAYFAFVGSTLVSGAFGQARGFSFLVFLAVLIGLALAGYERHKNFWLWARHHLIIGKGSSSLTREFLLLFGVPTAAFLLSFWLLAPAGGSIAFLFSTTVSGSIFCFAPFSFAKPYNSFVRGTNLLSTEKGATISAPKLPPGDLGFPWGGKVIRTNSSLLHQLFIGAVGAGKTKLMEGLIRSYLPTLKTLDARSLLFDPKREFLRYLDSLDLGVKVVILDPTDARCSAWAMAKDIQDEDDAKTLAEIFVPVNDKATQP